MGILGGAQIKLAVLAAMSAAALVCTPAHASGPDCSLRDVKAWKQRLADPTEEASPDYRLEVTQDFLHACPDRPERFEAHLYAGRAAVDADEPELALAHFQNARTSFRPLSTSAWFGLVAAHIETGNTDAAWKERDALIENWLDNLDKDGLAEIDTRNLSNGNIHSVKFIAREPGDYVRGVWVAVPKGAGWPSAIVLGSSQFRSAMHRLRAPEVERLEHFDLVGCQDRVTLSQSEGEINLDTAHLAAQAAAETYLEQPELPQDNGLSDMSAICSWPGEMLPRPDPYKAELFD